MKSILFLTLFILSACLQGQQKELNFSRGKDALAKENYNQALYYFDLAIKEDSLYIDAYNERGLAKSNIGDHRGALKDYLFVIKNDPENASAYFGIASIKDTWQNDKYGAISDYTKAIDISLRKNDPHYAGTCYFMRGLLKKSLGDQRGYYEDMKRGAELGNEAAIANFEFLKSIK